MQPAGQPLARQLQRGNAHGLDRPSQQADATGAALTAPILQISSPMEPTQRCLCPVELAISHQLLDVSLAREEDFKQIREENTSYPREEDVNQVREEQFNKVQEAEFYRIQEEVEEDVSHIRKEDPRPSLHLPDAAAPAEALSIGDFDAALPLLGDSDGLHRQAHEEPDALEIDNLDDRHRPGDMIPILHAEREASFSAAHDSKTMHGLIAGSTSSTVSDMLFEAELGMNETTESEELTSFIFSPRAKGKEGLSETPKQQRRAKTTRGRRPLKGSSIRPAGLPHVQRRRRKKAHAPMQSQPGMPRARPMVFTYAHAEPKRKKARQSKRLKGEDAGQIRCSPWLLIAFLSSIWNGSRRRHSVKGVQKMQPSQNLARA